MWNTKTIQRRRCSLSFSKENSVQKHKRQGMLLPELHDKGMLKHTHAKYAQEYAQKKEGYDNKINLLVFWSQASYHFLLPPYPDIWESCFLLYIAHSHKIRIHWLRLSWCVFFRVLWNGDQVVAFAFFFFLRGGGGSFICNSKLYLFIQVSLP